MKTITINVSEAMELYKTEKIEQKKSIKDLQPFSVGKILVPAGGRVDYLEEMDA